ncbi:MAG TPA: carboxypeptidase regulatory-like domain-containing protein [Terriglobales bacterium]|nr:carboxypeptidase regulatory-like domain-containing protein [Terriglobales bacterium]
MKHLTNDELGALLDGALEGGARRDAERHLESCADCRDALARLGALDESLRAALEHDPGEEYFGTFAARVGGRIRAAGLQGVQARGEGGGLAEWFRSPRKLAWVGTVAAVVAGAGIVMMVSREQRMPAIPTRDLGSRAAQESPADRALPAPPLAQAPSGSRARALPLAAAPAPESKAEVGASAPQARAEASPPLAGSAVPGARAYQVRRNEAGDEVPVVPPGFVYRPPRPAIAPAPPGKPVYAPKQQYALPATPAPEGGPLRGGVRPVTADEESAARAEAAAPSSAEAITPYNYVGGAPTRKAMRSTSQRVPGPGRVCGEVVDDAGRPVSGAQVADRGSGVSVSTAADGSFCLDTRGAAPEIAVMAVGFEPLWRTVQSGQTVRITLRAVSVLGGQSQAARAFVREARLAIGSSPAPGSAVPLARAFARGDTYLRIRGTNAVRLTTLAEQIGTAGAWDSAAAEWTRITDGVVGGALELPVSFQIARARYAAWRADRTAERADRARAALAEFLARAPAGAERDSALSWRRAAVP